MAFDSLDIFGDLIPKKIPGGELLRALFQENGSGSFFQTQNISLETDAPRGSEFTLPDNAKEFLAALDSEVQERINELEGMQGDFKRSISLGPDEEILTINGATREQIEGLLDKFQDLQSDIDQAQRSVSSMSAEERKMLYIDLYARATLLEREFERIETGYYI